MNFFKRKQVKPIIIRDDILQKICEELFPEPIEKEEDGKTYLVDYSVDMNIMSVINDIEDGNVDQVTKESLNDILRKLSKMRDILHANYSTENAQYLVVTTEDKLQRDETIKLF